MIILHSNMGFDWIHLLLNESLVKSVLSQCVLPYTLFLCRQDTVKDELCIPFQKRPVCHSSLRGTFYWPTSIPCADSLADMHFVDNNYTRQVFEIVSEAYQKCQAITSKVFSQHLLSRLLRVGGPQLLLTLQRGVR
jgi:hypothetical protein